MEITKRGIGNTADIKIVKYINMNKWTTLYLLGLLKDFRKAHEGKVTSKTSSQAQSKQLLKPNLDH